MKLMKKGNVGNIQGFILAIVGVAVVLAVGLIVLAELSDSTTDANATAATDAIIADLAGVPTWIGILITVALAFIVLGYFYARG